MKQREHYWVIRYYSHLDHQWCPWSAHWIREDARMRCRVLATSHPSKTWRVLKEGPRI